MEKISLANKIEKVFLDCLFKKDELDAKNEPVDKDALVVGYGLVRNFGFNKNRVEKHKDEINSFIELMDDTFKKNKGGGWSTLNLCMDRYGVQWGEHRNVEQLCALAVASKLGEYSLPREYWSSLPGGMPYITFNEKQ